jgi:hypothetical protein
MIHYTVGTGGDYSDWGAAYNALVAIGALADDYLLTQISDLTNSTVFSGNINLNNRKIEFLNGLSHGGNPNAGYKTYLAQGISINAGLFPPANFGIIVIDGLNIINVSATGTLVSLSMTIAGPTENPFSKRIYARNLLIKGKNLSAAPPEIGLSVGGAYLSANYVYNCKIWNCGYSGINLSFGIFGAAVTSYYYRFYENITCYNCARYGYASIYLNNLGFSGNPSLSLKNVVAVNTNDALYLPDWSFVNTGTNYLAVNNCADSDATCPDTYGTNNIHTIIPATEFESQDDTDATFLFLQKGVLISGASPNPDRGFAPLRTRFDENTKYNWPDDMRLYNSGQEPSLCAVDIANTEYGKYGDYPIGCHNAEVAY